MSDADKISRLEEELNALTVEFHKYRRDAERAQHEREKAMLKRGLVVLGTTASILGGLVWTYVIKKAG